MDTKIGSIIKPIGIMAAAVVILAGIKATAFLVGPLVLAALFVAVLRPAFQFMIQKRFPVAGATLITILLFIGIILFLGWVFTLAISQTVLILQDYGPGITSQLSGFQNTVVQLPPPAKGLSVSSEGIDPSLITNFLQGFIATLASFLANLIVLFFLFVFTLTGVPLILQRMREIFGEDHQLTKKTVSFLDNLARYFLLRTLVNAVTGLGIALGCILLGIPNAFVWGLLTFVLSYIPYIGMFIACVPPGIIAFAEGGVTELAIFIVICVIINGLAEQVLSPIITGRGLSISPIVIFVSFIFWGWLLGSVGYLVAVPMTLLVILFMNSFEETKGVAGLVSDIP